MAEYAKRLAAIASDTSGAVVAAQWLKKHMKQLSAQTREFATKVAVDLAAEGVKKLLLGG